MNCPHCGKDTEKLTPEQMQAKIRELEREVQALKARQPIVINPAPIVQPVIIREQEPWVNPSYWRPEITWTYPNTLGCTEVPTWECMARN